MDAEILHGFIKQTEEYLPLVRSGILICAQSGGVFGELSASLRQIASIKNSASILHLSKIETVCARFELELKSAIADDGNNRPLGDEDARRLLDRVAELEVLVAEIYFGAGDFSRSISDFVEESFGQFEPHRNEKALFEEAAEEAFEIDAEMLEVFAVEADELVRNFRSNLELLESAPAGNSCALPEMRRSAHTLKGSAGVVGLKNLSQFAHRVEDLLDCLAENEIVGDEKIFSSLLAATDCFEALAAGETSLQLTKKIERIYENIHEALSNADSGTPNAELLNAERGMRNAESKAKNRAETTKATVRISLEKLNELVEIAARLSGERENFERVFADGDLRASENLEEIFERQHGLIGEIQDKLLRLRMVRFGSLAPRLQRTARVACEEEEKIAELFVEGEDVEIDTLTVDAVVEPLLHLLRNAVAHGVEAPELRRLLGKPESGKITVRATCEAERIVISISDDGRGISADALRAKAIAAGFISGERAGRMTDDEAFELIFLNGLTTAETLSQTAGRGVGMNVVKTNIERQRGTIEIASEARKGTTFTVCLPRAPQISPRANPLSVLIVDDSPSIRRATSGVMENAGWNWQTAQNGLEALEILRAATRLPDVILTDAEMPQMDGYALLTALKNKENLRAIPVVMITSRAEDAYRQKAAALGVSDFLTKPCADEVLLERIKSLVNEKLKTKSEGIVTRK